MLQLSPPTPVYSPPPADDRSGAGELDLRWLIGAIRRRIWSILLLCAIGAALAATYVVLRPSNYTAFTQLQLTNLRLTFSRDDAFYAESQSDPTFLETQIQIMRSGKIALAVVNSMGLGKPQEGVEEKTDGLTSLLAQGRAWIDQILRSDQNAVAPSPEGEPADNARREALKKLQRSYAVERVGLSNIVEIRFTAPDRDQAARGANELAQAYIADQQAARIEAAQSASIWLRERLRDVGPRARIVATAVPPLDKSDPRGVMIVAVGFILGGVIGVALALARQFFDGAVRTPEQAESVTGVECLGIVPKLKARGGSGRAPTGDGAIAKGAALLNEAVQSPFGELARALQNVRVAIDDGVAGPRARRIGVTSTYPGEGVSVVAANLARYLAAQGERVLLVDCNTCDAGLSTELVADAKTADRSMRSEGSLSFLPLALADASGRTEPLWPQGTPDFLKTVGERFDYVVCDLPSLASIGDVRGAALHLDSFLLVLNWGKVDAEHLRVAVRSAGAFRVKLLGFVLNRANRGGIKQTASPSAAFFMKKHPHKRSAG